MFLLLFALVYVKQSPSCRCCLFTCLFRFPFDFLCNAVEKQELSCHRPTRAFGLFTILRALFPVFPSPSRGRGFARRSTFAKCCARLLAHFLPPLEASCRSVSANFVTRIGAVIFSSRWQHQNGKNNNVNGKSPMFRLKVSFASVKLPGESARLIEAAH